MTDQYNKWDKPINILCAKSGLLSPYHTVPIRRVKASSARSKPWLQSIQTKCRKMEPEEPTKLFKSPVISELRALPICGIWGRLLVTCRNPQGIGEEPAVPPDIHTDPSNAAHGWRCQCQAKDHVPKLDVEALTTSNPIRNTDTSLLLRVPFRTSYFSFFFLSASLDPCCLYELFGQKPVIRSLSCVSYHRFLSF